ncbi:MAG: cytochrome c peroxidase [Sphingobacteriales bacterium]|jgi:cytochrome c peroxidase
MRKLFILFTIFCFIACEEEAPPSPDIVIADPEQILTRPAGFPPLPEFPDNPFSIEGIAMGKTLFFSKVLSKDYTLSCGSCHAPANGFSDSAQFSTGFNGAKTPRNSMPLHNLIYEFTFFWDGRVVGLENQVLEPVSHPDEMNLPWDSATVRLESTEVGARIKAFYNTPKIDRSHVANLISQYIRSLISGNSKFDLYRQGLVPLTESEIRGMHIFQSEGQPENSNLARGGDCFHCHTLEAGLFTDFSFHNNGLDENPADPGLGNVTGNPNDHAKFKTPSLRNLSYTGPYMHDGRFSSLEEVIDHYISGVKESPTLDPLMKFQGGLFLSETEKTDLINFLNTLNDHEFIQNHTP